MIFLLPPKSNSIKQKSENEVKRYFTEIRFGCVLCPGETLREAPEWRMGSGNNVANYQSDFLAIWEQYPQHRVE